MFRHLVCIAALVFAVLFAAPFEALCDSAPQLVNQTLTARQDVPLRESAPRGLLFRKGKYVATLKEGTRVDVKEQRSFATYRGMDIWIRIVPVNKELALPSGGGWAYYGNATQSENFR